MTTVIKKVAFFGSATMPEKSPVWEKAFKTARLLAENGFTVVNGGGPGIMKAASLGAKSVGGEVIGVTFYPTDMKHFEGRDLTNPLDKEIKTKNYLERTLVLLEMAECFIIFKGGTGTVSEFGMAWGLAKLYFGHHKSLILFGEFWENIMESFEKNLELDKEELACYETVNEPEEVLESIDRLDKKIARLKHAKDQKSPFSI